MSEELEDYLMRMSGVDANRLVGWISMEVQNKPGGEVARLVKRFRANRERQVVESRLDGMEEFNRKDED